MATGDWTNDTWSLRAHPSLLVTYEPRSERDEYPWLDVDGHERHHDKEVARTEEVRAAYERRQRQIRNP